MLAKQIIERTKGLLAYVGKRLLHNVNRKILGKVLEEHGIKGSLAIALVI